MLAGNDPVALGAGGPGFESRRPDTSKLKPRRSLSRAGLLVSFEREARLSLPAFSLGSFGPQADPQPPSRAMNSDESPN
jgi:hypothetical protein